MSSDICLGPEAVGGGGGGGGSLLSSCTFIDEEHTSGQVVGRPLLLVQLLQLLSMEERVCSGCFCRSPWRRTTRALLHRLLLLPAVKLDDDGSPTCWMIGGAGCCCKTTNVDSAAALRVISKWLCAFFSSSTIRLAAWKI